jgi:hypothetical protein
MYKKSKKHKKIHENQPCCDTAGTRTVENNFKIAQINLEGLTRAKADILGKRFVDMDVLVLQETHIPDGETNRLKINGFNLVHHIGHNKHDLATYVSQNKSFLDIEQVTGNEHTVGIHIGNLTIFNVYKPPPSKWAAAVLPVSEHPVIYIGDFNSQNTEWGYSTNNEEGERLSDWAAINHLKLIYDAKQEGTFKSGRWGTTTSPDLCFVSEDSNGLPLTVNREIKNSFPRSQHLPITMTIGLIIPTIDKPFMPCWNLRKAAWSEFSKYVDDNIKFIDPIPDNYGRFIKLIKTAAKKSIPRGHRHNYIPCWTKE